MRDDFVGESPDVRVERTVYPAADPLPTVVLWIANDRTTPVTVRLIDSLPEDATADAVEFSGFERDRWQLTRDGNVAYRRELDAQDVVIATYYVRCDDLPADDQPVRTVEVLECGADEQGPTRANDVPHEPSRAWQEDVEDRAEESRRLLPDGGRIEGPHEPDLSEDGAEDRDRVRGPALFHSEFDDQEEAFLELLAEHHPISWGEVTRTMLDELRHGSLDDDLVAELREALLGDMAAEELSSDASDTSSGGGADIPSRIEVRLDRLHTKVERLAAYEEALEEFIDEHGTGQQAVDSLSRRLDTVEEELGAVSDSVGEIQSEVSADTDRVDDIETVMSDLRLDVESLERRLDEEATGGVDEDELEAIESRLDELEQLESRIDEVEDRSVSDDAVDKLQDQLDTVDERTATLEESLDTVTDRMDDLEQQFEASEDAGSSEEELEAIKETVEANEAAIGDMRDTVDTIDETFTRLTQVASDPDPTDD